MPRSLGVTSPIGVVSVHFERQRVMATLRSIGSLRAQVPSSRTVYVANSLDAMHELRSALGQDLGSDEILLHDNSGWEFGGYQAGLERLVQSETEWFLFANDTFSTHQVFPPEYEQSLLSELARTVDHPIAVGQIESLRRSFVIAGHRTHRWITTNIFALNRAALHVLDGRIHDLSIERDIVESRDRSAFFGDDLDPVLRAHLDAWLFKNGAEAHWYRAQELRDDNMAWMAKKARSILQEKRLTASLEGASAELVDIKEIGLLRELRRRIRLRLGRDPRP